ncbi:MAG: histidinol-phosphatase [Nitrososphaerota archaeon]
MRVKIDYHVHTEYTWDAKGNVEDYCKIAEHKGIEEIVFTNHFIPFLLNVPKGSITKDGIEKHFKEIEEARKKYNLKIKIGLEIDYNIAYEKIIENILNEYQFDFILGSIHFIDGIDIIGNQSSMFFKDKNMNEAYERYFSELKKIVKSGLIDVLAHPDYIRRSAIKYYGEDFIFEDNKNIIEELLDLMIKNDVGLEINTSGYRHGLNDSFPKLEFLKFCFKKGLRKITIGSDAHSPEYLTIFLEKGIEKIKNVGYNEICIFNKRKPSWVPIESIVSDL